MAGYYEGDFYPMNCGYSNNGGFGGESGWWGIILLALLFGWGRGGNGFGGGYGNGGSEVLGYELGRVATTNDVASGFNNSAVLNKLNDLTLGQAGLQQTLCQGFNGINTAILQSDNAFERGIATTNFNLQNGFNGISNQISSCCCETQRMLERQTCDLINNQNANTQRIMDHLYYKELEAVKSERDDYKLQLSQARQTSTIINSLNPQAIPAYIVQNPNCCYNPCNGAVIQ